MDAYRSCVLALLALAIVCGGCFKMEVNVPQFGGSAGGNSASSAGKSEPSQLPAAGGGWKDVAIATAGSLIAAENGMLFFAYDSLAYPAKPVDLEAKLVSATRPNMPGLEGVSLGFYRDDELLGLGETDSGGRAKITFTPDKPGVYSLTVKPTAAPKEHEKAMSLAGAPLILAVRDKQTPIVVIDLDHTVVDSSFFRVLAGGAKRMPDSVEVTKRIAKDYCIVYLTARPDLLARKSKLWLIEGGYPPGPLMLSSVSTMFDSQQFKQTRLGEVRKAYPNTNIGIGDKISDAQAYVNNDMTAYLIPHYKDKPKDIRKKAAEISHIRVRGKGKLHVVDSWRKVEAGMFAKASFPAGPFVKSMIARAERLEADERERKAEEKRREKEDEEEDD